MNRSTGAYTRLTFKQHCIVLRLATGGCYQTVVEETSSKRALGRAFGNLRQDNLAPAAVGAVVFCKTPDRMTEDERWQWGVQTSADEARWLQKQQETRLPASELDLY